MTIREEGFTYRLEEGVAHVTLARPDRINALTFASYRALTEAFREMHETAAVRSVVLSGEGPRGFCSGGDVRDIIGELFSRDMPGLLEFTRLTGALVASIHTCRAPVVAALHGVTCGAGAVMAVASDIRIASPDMRIAFLFPKVGLSGADMGASWLLPRIVGFGHASELLLTGEFVEAARAEKIGLVNRVVPLDQLHESARALAKSIAAGPSFAHGMTKKMLDYETSVDFLTGIEAEAQAQAICMQHSDFREAYDAGREKRPPKFR